MNNDFSSLRADFPILKELVRGKKLIYFDNAATAQKPQPVLDALLDFYKKSNANVHRGVHTLAVRADTAYWEARQKVQKFIGAKKAKEIIFVRGTTEAINLVAQSYGRTFLKEGDEILLSTMEHHSNIVPWQLAGGGLKLKITPISLNADNTLNLDHYRELLKREPKLVAITHVSNVLGCVNPIKEMVRLAHDAGAVVLVDGAQAVPHLPVNVTDLDCDFYAFSGHKMYGPTGIGVLYGKEKWLTKMAPYQGGGGMIQSVKIEKTLYAELPDKFEAGTPAIAEAIALGATIDYLQKIGFAAIKQHETELLQYAKEKLRQVAEVRFIGNFAEQAGVISLVFGTVHPHDLATILDSDGIAVRAGHHCAMPLMDFLKVPATLRISFGVYNTKEEIDQFILSLSKVKRIFGYG